MNKVEPTSDVLYENTVLVNPGKFFGFKKLKPITMIVTSDKGLVFETNPKIVIPFNTIKAIKYSFWFSGRIKIFITSGEIYKLVWASEGGGASFKYSPLETADVFNNLKRIIK